MLTVLATALEHAPPAPVLSRLPATAKVLMSAGRAARAPPALRGVVRCIGLLVATLRAAPSAQAVLENWEHCAKPFAAISNLCVDGRPKVRKQAAASVGEALRALRETPAADPAGRAFSAVAVKSLRAPGKAARELADMHGAAGAKAAEQRAQAAAAESLHLLGALKRILGELSPSPRRRGGRRGRRPAGSLRAHAHAARMRRARLALRADGRDGDLRRGERSRRARRRRRFRARRRHDDGRRRRRRRHHRRGGDRATRQRRRRGAARRDARRLADPRARRGGAPRCTSWTPRTPARAPCRRRATSW